MFKKLGDKILDGIESILRDTGVRLLDVIFLLELVYFKFLSKLIDKNLLIWNNIDLGLYLYNFGESIYFNHILAEIIICTVTPIVLILLHLSSKYSEYLYQCTDGFSRGYSAFAGLMRFFRLIWYFLHDGWIIFH